MNHTIRLIDTDDGSKSLFVEGMNETYHSRHGAVQESEFVFIRNGLQVLLPQLPMIQVLEVGFGTGLNAWLTLQKKQTTTVAIHYTALETNPLPESIYSQLNYDSFQASEKQSAFMDIHKSPWNTSVEVSSGFVLQKINCPIQEFTPDGMYHLVYYDAFGPLAQPDMWNISIFKRIYDAMHAGGILVTYCAKGQVRRDLQHVGFTVERLPGPPGKREMLRASKV